MVVIRGRAGNQERRRKVSGRDIDEGWRRLHETSEYVETATPDEQTLKNEPVKRYRIPKFSSAEKTSFVSFSRRPMVLANPCVAAVEIHSACGSLGLILDTVTM